jgi:hypothetical protein
MSAPGTQALGVFLGAVVMGAILVATSEAATDPAASPCQTSPPPGGPVHISTSPPLRISKIALPMPPPLTALAAETPSRPARPPAETSTPDLAKDPRPPARQRQHAAKFREPDNQPPRRRSYPAPLNAGKSQEVAGRPLLRLLEHGQGPSIEIAWPDHSVARAKLYALLKRCHGLRTVLLRDQEILMSARAGATETFDGDRHSGFIRAIQGPSPGRERVIIKKLRARHGARNTTPVRLLSRRFDARLLGGLSRLTGSDYRGAKAVTARYAVAGERVMVQGLSIDGKRIAGRIEISPLGQCRNTGA